MTMEADWRDSGGVPSRRPRLLAPGLTILAQFDGAVVLDRADVERLTGCTRSIARWYLVMLCDLGYLTEEQDGAYRLVRAQHA